MAERRVKVSFQAEVQNFKSGMAEAAASTRKVKDAAEAAAKATEQSSKVSADAAAKAAEASKRQSAAVEHVGTLAMGAGLATVAGVGMAVKAYADFDKQMSSVRAATGETAGNMDLLREAAVKAGADTSFSAGEAAQGIEELAKAGVSTADILGGGLDGALALAAAGSLDVGSAAEIAASALTQFKLSGEDIPHIADLLSAGAGKAQGSVSDMGAALNQVGLVAAQTGLTIEETTGGLAAFASAGLIGSDAGTSFKTMLAALTPNSEAAAKAMEDLGLSAYDSQGNFIGLSEFAGKLKSSLSTLTDEQRNSTLETIFGSDAVRAAAVLYEQGAEGVQKWEDAVNDAGHASRTAALLQDNLAGDIEKLGGSIDSVFLKSGSGANDFLRGLARGAEDAVDWIGQLDPKVLSAGAALAGIVGVAALAGGAFITVVPKIRDTRDALNELMPAGGKARSALERVGKAAEGLGALATGTLIIAKLAESSYLAEIDTGMGKVADAIAEVTTNAPGAADALDSLFRDRNGGDLIRGVDDLNTAMQRTFNKNRDQEFNDWAEGIVGAWLPIQGSSHMLADAFGRVDDSLASMVSSGKGEEAAKVFSEIEAAAKIQGATVEELAAKFPAYNDALASASAEAKEAAAGGDAAATSIAGVGAASAGAAPLSEEVSKALEDIGLSAQGAVTDMVKFTDALVNAGLLQLSARDAARGYEAAIDAVSEAVTANGTTMDINTEKGRANQAALDAVASAGFSVVKANAANGDSQKSLQGNLKGTYNDLIAAAGQFGITGQSAINLAREVLKVPDGVSIDSWMSSAAKSMAEQTTGAINNIPKVTNIHVNTYKTEFHHVQRSESVTTGSGPRRDGQRDAFARGGRVKGYADGGKLPTTGPGTGSVDGILGVSSVSGIPTARVDAGEWVINRRSSDKYHGVLAAINAGTYKAYADGGRVYTTPSYNYASAAHSAPSQAASIYVQNPWTGEYMLARTVNVAQSVLAKSDSQSQYMRTGRG